MIYLSAFLFVLLVTISMFGEKLLPFFGNDVASARKTVVPVMMLCAAGAFGLPLPHVFMWIADKQQKAVALGGSDGAIANWVKADGFRNMMEVGGWVALVVVFAFFIGFAVLFATGRIGGM